MVRTRGAYGEPDLEPRERVRRAVHVARLANGARSKGDAYCDRTWRLPAVPPPSRWAFDRGRCDGRGGRWFDELGQLDVSRLIAARIEFYLLVTGMVALLIAANPVVAFWEKPRVD
jgi:hypothetical protein